MSLYQDFTKTRYQDITCVFLHQKNESIFIRNEMFFHDNTHAVVLLHYI